MKYLGGTFSVPMSGNQQYRDNWDAIFKPKDSHPCEDSEVKKAPEVTPEPVLEDYGCICDEEGCPG